MILGAGSTDIAEFENKRGVLLRVKGLGSGNGHSPSKIFYFNAILSAKSAPPLAMSLEATKLDQFGYS